MVIKFQQLIWVLPLNCTTWKLPWHTTKIGPFQKIWLTCRTISRYFLLPSPVFLMIKSQFQDWIVLGFGANAVSMTLVELRAVGAFPGELWEYKSPRICCYQGLVHASSMIWLVIRTGLLQQVLPYPVGLAGKEAEEIVALYASLCQYVVQVNLWHWLMLRLKYHLLFIWWCLITVKYTMHNERVSAVK